MKITLSVIFSQFDTRWSSIFLGFNTSNPYNIYNFGCLITCLAMVLKYYGQDQTPQTVNDKLKEIKGFTAGGGDYIWGSITRAFKAVKEIKTDTPDLLTDAQIGEIKSAIDSGFPVMIQIDYNPQTVANETHYVLIIDYDPNDENNFTISDPLGGSVHSLKDYLKFFKPSARKSISQYIVYQGTVPVHGSDMIDVLAKDFPNLVHGSTEWDKTVHEYVGADADPKTQNFENVQKVVAAFKGQASGAQGQVQQLSQDLAVANSEVKNREEQVGRLNAQLLERDKIHRAELDALKATFPDATKLKVQYDSSLRAKQIEVDEAKKEVGALNKKIAALENVVPNDKLINRIIGILKSLLSKK